MYVSLKSCSYFDSDHQILYNIYQYKPHTRYDPGCMVLPFGIGASSLKEEMHNKRLTK